jgi:uncharacterized ferredoxin-like protein
MIYSSLESEKAALLDVARLMVSAARTAPKAKGVDTILTMIVDGQEKDALADEMRKISEGGEAFDYFARDADNVDNSEFVVLIAVIDKPVDLTLCSVCGFKDCASAAAAGSPCAFNLSDLGTATGSACAVASLHWVDNRLMYTAGRAAIHIDLFGEKVRQCYGIPISAKGKSIYFDRK